MNTAFFLKTCNVLKAMNVSIFYNDYLVFSCSLNVFALTLEQVITSADTSADTLVSCVRLCVSGGFS